MKSLIERYVYDVVRRLPEDDRDEMSRELTANIRDMLPDDADEAAVRAVLNSLGPPALLAEKYRQKPRYLISPAVYDEYVRTLKWVVPLVGVILLVVGGVFGAIDAIRDGMVDASVFFSGIFSQGISFGVSGAFQALVWTTVGFVIAERAGAKIGPAADAWTVDDLPETIPNDKGKIPLTDSIVELVVVAVFSVLGILFCLGVFPIFITINNDITHIYNIFSDGFLAVCIPAIAIGCLLGVAECVVKIAQRRWTPLVCGTVVVSNLGIIALMLWLFTRGAIFSPAFTAYIQSQAWRQVDVLRFMGDAVTNPLLLVIVAIVIVASLAECGVAVYKTVRASRA